MQFQNRRIVHQKNHFSWGAGSLICIWPVIIVPDDPDRGDRTSSPIIINPDDPDCADHTSSLMKRLVLQQILLTHCVTQLKL